MTNNESKFLLDGEPVTLGEFLAANDDPDVFTAEDIAEVKALPVGGTITYGGGAAALFVLERVA